MSGRTIFGRNLDREVAIVAEIGNNHEGSFSRAEEMIGQAAEAGADAVKFQTYRVEHFIHPKDTERYERLRRFQLSEEDFERLSGVAKKYHVHFFSTPLDLGSAAFLNRICPVFKVASSDNTFYPLLEKLALFRKPILLSTGLASTEEIRIAKERIEKCWREDSSPFLLLLHCVTNYPVAIENANVSAIAKLKQEFGGYVGYSDHTIGNRAAFLAVGSGACLIEKHFTLDKNQSSFRDHQISADPKEFRELVGMVRDGVRLQGNGAIGVEPCEEPLIPSLRRSIVAARDLPKGHTVRIEDITWLRMTEGVRAGHESEILGKTLRVPRAKGGLIVNSDLE